MARYDMRKNCMEAVLHCSKCLGEKPDGVVPADWARLNVGWTEKGLQVWCTRHELNVIHIDFEGVQHKAEVNTR